jgi:hypothetical protein
MFKSCKDKNLQQFLFREVTKWRIYKSTSLSLFSIFLILNFVVFASQGYAQTTDDSLILDDLIKTALENNPQLKSFQSAIKADSAKIPQSGSLPDPV